MRDKYFIISYDSGTTLQFSLDLESDLTIFNYITSFFNPLIFRNVYEKEINQKYPDLIKDTDQNFAKLAKLEIIAAHLISKHPTIIILNSMFNE